MTRAFLEKLGLGKDVVDSIMAENGRDIESAKSGKKEADEAIAKLTKQLEAATKESESTKGMADEIARLKTTMKDPKDFDALSAQLEKYKAELSERKKENEKIAKEAADKVAAIERKGQVKDFLSSKKFVNDITRDAIGTQLEGLLNSDDSRGKSLDDLLKGITDGKANIFEGGTKATPPVQGGLNTSTTAGANMLQEIDTLMGIPPSK